MENNKISKIEIGDTDENKLNEFVSYEREAAIYDLIAENSFDAPVKFKRIGISDHFPHGYGSQEHMMKRNGISSDHATIAAKKLLGNYS